MVRLTNSARGARTVSAVLVAVPADALLEPPVDPRSVSTDVINCEPGRNTICPSVTVPVCVCPSAACQSSTAVVVASCHVSLRAI